jgi:hypothetical protein
MEVGEIGRTFSIHWRYEKFIYVLVRKPEGRGHFADPDVGG